MGTLWQDIRYGFRMLGKNPGFTAVVVIVLGIGIGATTAMLSVVDAIMLRPCPYERPETLVCLYETKNPERTQRDFTSLAGFRDWREQSHAFERLAGADQWNGIVRVAGRTERARAFAASEGLFSVLGAQPILGRTFLPEEYGPGAAPVVILSYDHWRHWFGGDPNVIGKTMTMDNQVCTVVGVLPEGFRWVFQVIACGLWRPLSLDDTSDTDRDDRGLQVVARLRAGVSVAQAQAEMDLIAERLAQSYPQTHRDRGIRVVPINTAYTWYAGDYGKPRTLVILLAVVASVLLIACLHVASLLIARSITRDREIAVRAALGAHRLRLIRQFFAESALLGALGGSFGAVLTYWALHILSALRGRSIPWNLGKHTDLLIPWFVEVRMDWRCLLYTLGISLLTCVAFGVLPAVGASRTNLNQSLSAGRTLGRVPRFYSLRSGLVVLDIAIAFVLLIGTGLMVHSFARILQIDLRYNPRGVLTTEVAFDWEQSPEPQRRLAVFQEAVKRVARLPGVQSATAADNSPVTGSFSTSTFRIEGLPPGEDRVDTPRMEVFPNFFRVLQIPLLNGRYFTEQDDKTAAKVAIINEAMARRFWPQENPVGQSVLRVARNEAESVLIEIVGVVGNVWHSRYGPEEPEIYLPYLQSGYPPEVELVIRTAGDPKSLVRAIRQEVSAAAGGAAVGDVTLIEEQVAALFSSERFNLLFLGAFAAMALLLASLGVYGTIAYAVSRRTHEIGIRMALGARSRDIVRAVLNQGLRLTLAGLALGFAGALAATRIIRSLLYEVSPTDPLTFACVGLLLAGVALLASYLPARRAARIDPMVALRYE